MASTIFIAVKCYKCSTMQVKQRKKSSNKWRCVICDEKQSIMKVFAQAYMAKDVRHFVQSFNMGRCRLAEQIESVQLQTTTPVDDSMVNEEIPTKKRTDWSEYMDQEKDDDDDDEGDVFEKRAVTEMPKAVFKKPKLRDCCAVSGGGVDIKSRSGEKLFRPVFGKKNFNKKPDSFEKQPNEHRAALVNLKQSCYPREADDIFADKELIRPQPSNNRGAFLNVVDNFADKVVMRGQPSNDIRESRWRDCITLEDGDDNDNIAGKVPWQRGATTVKGATSKWNEYISEDDSDDGLRLQTGKSFEDHYHEEKQPSEPGAPLANLKWSNYPRQGVDIFGDKELTILQPSKDKGLFPNVVGKFSVGVSMSGQPSKHMKPSKWIYYDNENLARKAQRQRWGTAVKGAGSKWNEYITDDDSDDDSRLGSGKSFEDNHTSKWNYAAFETTSNDQTVEDDIHPDFQ